MAVQLSTLRVQADLDASGYKRGADQKISADKAMVAAMQDCVARQAAYTDALTKHADALREAGRAQQQHEGFLSRGADAINKFGGAYITAKDALREWNAANDNANRSALETIRNYTLAARALSVLTGIALP